MDDSGVDLYGDAQYEEQDNYQQDQGYDDQGEDMGLPGQQQMEEEEQGAGGGGGRMEEEEAGGHSGRPAEQEDKTNSLQVGKWTGPCAGASLQCPLLSAAFTAATHACPLALLIIITITSANRSG